MGNVELGCTHCHLERIIHLDKPTLPKCQISHWFILVFCLWKMITVKKTESSCIYFLIFQGDERRAPALEHTHFQFFLCLKLDPRVLFKIETVPLMAAIWTWYLFGLPGIESRWSCREFFIIPVAPIIIGSTSISQGPILLWGNVLDLGISSIYPVQLCWSQNHLVHSHQMIVLNDWMEWSHTTISGFMAWFSIYLPVCIMLS